MNSIGDSIVTPPYTAEERETWSILMVRQASVLAAIACRAFLEGLRTVDLVPTAIPQLSAVDCALRERTGWRIARAPGLIESVDFFSLLSERVFPCVDRIRPRREIDFTPAPDVFHDVFAHAPMLTQPTYADFMQRLGRAAIRADAARIRCIERIYWFAIEFGLVRESGSIKVFGNAILSSLEESRRCLSYDVERRPFDLATILDADYRLGRFQDRLFVLDSFEQLAAAFDRWASAEGLV